MSFVPTSNINVGIFTRELAANFLNVIVTISDEFLYKQLSTARQVATQRQIASQTVFQLGLKSVQYWKQNHKDVFQARVIAQNRQISDMYVFCLYAYIRELYEESLCKVEVQIQRPTLGTFLHTYMRTVCDSVPVGVGEYFRMSYMEKRLFVENMIRMAFYNIVVQQNSVKAIIPLDNPASSVAAAPRNTRNVQVIQTPVRNAVTPPMSPYVTQNARVDAPMSASTLSSKRSSIVISEAKDVEEEFLQILDPRQLRSSASSVESGPASALSISLMPKPSSIASSIASMPKPPSSVASVPPSVPSIASVPSIVLVPPSVPSVASVPPSVPSVASVPPSVPSVALVPPSVPSVASVPPSVPSVASVPPAVPLVSSVPAPSVSSMPAPLVSSVPAPSVSSMPAPLVSSVPAPSVSSVPAPSLAPSSSSANLLSTATIKTSDAGEKPIEDYKMLAAVPSSHGGSSNWSVPNTASSQSATNLQKPEQKQSLSVLFEAAMGDHVQRPSAAAPSEHHVYSIASQFKPKPKPDVKKRKSHEETYDDLELPTSEMTFGEDVKDLLADNTMSITPQDSVSYVAGFD